MEEMEGVLFVCHFVMNAVAKASVPSALAELSMSCRGQRQSQTQEKLYSSGTGGGGVEMNSAKSFQWKYEKHANIKGSKEDVKTMRGKKSKERRLRESFNKTCLIIIKDLGFLVCFFFNVAESF